MLPWFIYYGFKRNKMVTISLGNGLPTLCVSWVDFWLWMRFDFNAASSLEGLLCPSPVPRAPVIYGRIQPSVHGMIHTAQATFLAWLVASIFGYYAITRVTDTCCSRKQTAPIHSPSPTDPHHQVKLQLCNMWCSSNWWARASNLLWL